MKTAKSQISIKWFFENKMIVNPDGFKNQLLFKRVIKQANLDSF